MYINEKSLVKSGAVAIAMALFICGNIGHTLSMGGSTTNTDLSIYMVPPVNELYSELDDAISIANNRIRNKNLKDEREALKEQIAEEIRLGEIEMLAQLIEAEAGNQDMKGKRLVGDVVMNRLRAGWAETVEEIIFQDNQFSSTFDGNYDSSAWYISEESFEAAYLAYTGETLDSKILYFTAGNYNPSGTPAYKYGDHYFSYK